MSSSSSSSLSSSSVSTTSAQPLLMLHSYSVGESVLSSSSPKKKPVHSDIGQTVKKLQKATGQLMEQFDRAGKDIEKHLKLFAKLDLSARSVIQASGAHKIGKVAKDIVAPVMQVRYKLLDYRLGVAEHENPGMFLINTAAQLFQNPNYLNTTEGSQRLYASSLDLKMVTALSEVREHLREHQGKRKEDTSPLTFSAPLSSSSSSSSSSSTLLSFSSSSTSSGSFLSSDESDPLSDPFIDSAVKAQVMWEVGLKYDELNEKESLRVTHFARAAEKTTGVGKSLSKERQKSSELAESLQSLLTEEPSFSAERRGKSSSKKTPYVDGDSEAVLESLKSYKKLITSSSRLPAPQSKLQLEPKPHTRNSDEETEMLSEEPSSSFTSKEHGQKQTKASKKDEVDGEELIQTLRAYGELQKETSRLGPKTKGELHGKSSKDTRALRENIRKLEASKGNLVLQAEKLGKKLNPLAKKLQAMESRLDKLPEDVSSDVYRAANIRENPIVLLQKFIQVMNQFKACKPNMDKIDLQLEEARSKLSGAQLESNRDLSGREHKPNQKQLVRQSSEPTEAEGDEGSNTELPVVDLSDFEKSKGPGSRPVINLLRLCYNVDVYAPSVNQAEQALKLYNEIPEPHQAVIADYLFARAPTKDKGGCDKLDNEALDDWVREHIADDMVRLAKACALCFKRK